MKLKDYLYFNNLSLKQMAAIVECNPNYLGRIVNGHMRASLNLAKSISQETGHEVSVEDIRGKDEDWEEEYQEIFG